MPEYVCWLRKNLRGEYELYRFAEVDWSDRIPRMIARYKTKK